MKKKVQINEAPVILESRGDVIKTKKQKLTIIDKNRITLDSKHKKYLADFYCKKSTLPLLKSELSVLSTQLNLIKDTLSIMDNRQKSLLLDKICKLKTTIYEIENNKDEVKYFYNTLSILKKYYKPEISGQQDTDEEEMIIIGNKLQKNNVIDKFSNDNKAELYDKYLSTIDSISHKKNNVVDSIQDTCSLCSAELVINTLDGTITCTECGDSQRILIDNGKPNYKDPSPDNSSYNYKRMNHLNEILSQMQAKESTLIPKSVYSRILTEIEKSKRLVNNLELLNPEIMRKILKNLELHNYYEHIQYIINKINKIPPPRFKREDEDKIRSMFREIQEPYEKCKPTNRKNFLNYFYVIHKFCELLELDDFLPYLPLLKNQDKLQLQDKIWKKICNILKWQYIPSYQHVNLQKK